MSSRIERPLAGQPEDAPVPPAAEAGWAYFLDVDGTLLELAETPDAVVVDAALLRLLAGVHGRCGGALALVSGRALADLDRRLPQAGLAKAGQHGLERRDGTGRLWRHATPAPARAAIDEVVRPLQARHPGLLLEDKGLTLAIHYRQAPSAAGPLRQLLRQRLAGLAGCAAAGLVVQEGKCVIEIVPAGIDKGTAVAEFLAEPPFVGRRPVFVGDDRSDEHGFAVVNARDGLSIAVGTARGEARYCLPDVPAVRAWLATLLT